MLGQANRAQASLQGREERGEGGDLSTSLLLTVQVTPASPWRSVLPKLRTGVSPLPWQCLFTEEGAACILGQMFAFPFLGFIKYI